MKSVAIIGAGIAGLTAGWNLNQDFSVHIFEQSEHLGGVMSTHQENGYFVEKGPNTILESSKRVTEIISKLGLEKQKIYPDDCAKIRYIVKDNILTPLPQSPPALVKSTLFSKAAKLRLLKEPFVAKGHKEENIAEFVKRRLGKEFLDYAINPFVAGTYAGKPENLSVQHAFPKLYQLEKKYRSLFLGQMKSAKIKKKQNQFIRSRICSFQNGIATLPLKMAAEIGHKNITLGCQVDNIFFQNNKWNIATKENVLTQADYVMYAGTISGLKNITIHQNQVSEFSALQNIYYPPVAVLSLGFKREDVMHNLDGFGFLVPEVEKSKILGTLFCSSLFKNRAPQGNILLTTFIGGTRQPELALLDETTIIENTLTELKKYLGIKNSPHFQHLTKWEKSIPQYEVGYGKYKDTFDHLEKKYPGLFFIGNYRNGVSIVDTILCADTFAQAIRKN